MSIKVKIKSIAEGFIELLRKDEFDAHAASINHPYLLRTYNTVKAVDVLDVPETYTNIATLVSSNCPAGTYELKLAMAWIFDRTTNSAYFRWRETDEQGVFSNWNEIIKEPTDKTDVNATSYFYPQDWTGGVKTIEVEVRKETGAGVFDVLFLDIVWERKI